LKLNGDWAPAGGAAGGAAQSVNNITMRLFMFSPD
jgi:hypothetical protein